MPGVSARRVVAAAGSLAIVCGLLTSLGVAGATTASAEPLPITPAAVAPTALPANVTAEKVGWNVVGLDSNRVTIGPNQFPNGVRICNTSGSTVSGHANWTWLDSTYAANIYLDGDDSISWSIATGACRSVYWTIEVQRSSASYNKTRNFDIDVTTTSTAGSQKVVANQQIYVEKLVSQNRNTVGTLTGPGIGSNTTQVLVGQEYTYTLTGATAPGGYEQVEFAAIFDPAFFEILEVNQIYGSNSAPASRVPTPNPQMYADACLWDNNPNSPTYRSCLSTGKAGGNMTATFRVRIIGQGTSRLNTLIYDFSGSSYHYNADYGFGPEITTILPALAVTKTASGSSFTGSGESTTFTIVGTNTGDDTLVNLVLDDTTTRTGGASVALSVTNCSPSLSGLQLAPGASFTCTYVYSTTTADVTAGGFTNTATVRGQGQSSGTPVSQSSAVTLTYSNASDAITVTKSASPAIFTTDDTQITYTISAYSSNSAAGDWTFQDNPITSWQAGCPTKTYAGIASDPAVCVGYYTITQADRDRGYIDNTATVSRFKTGQGTRTGTASARVTYAGLTTGIDLVKSASPTSYTASDDTIGYTFTVTNTGDDTLSNLSISDQGLDAPAVCATTTLSAGASTTCTGVHTLTQANRDASTLTNTAKAITTSTNGSIVSDDDSVTVTNVAPVNASLSLTKTSTSSSFGGVGDVIPYTFTVTNTGDVTINSVSIDDTQLDAPGAVCQSTTLVPTQTTTCVGKHTVTAADVSAGQVINTATANGTPTRGALTPPTATLTTPYVLSEITVVKTARDDTVAGVGSATTFDIRVINTGNTTLNSITIDDTIVRTGADSSVPVTCTRPLPANGLAPGDSFTCTANYTVTQADVDEGQIDNTVVAQATDDTGVVDDSSVAQVLGPTPAPRLTIDKTAITDSFYNPGERVDYSFTIRNRGNVTVSGVAVVDPQVLPQPIPCTSTTLAPGQSTTCQAYYIVQAGDTSQSWLANTATATGTPAIGQLPPVEPSTAYVPRVPAPSLAVTKSVDDTTFTTVGQVRNYSITVSNSSPDDSLYNLTLNDPLFPGADPFGGLTCPGDDTLAPSESMTCTAAYTITQEDMNRGFVENTVTAIGLTSAGRPLVARDAVIITGPSNVTTGITVTKSSTFSYFTTVGDTLTFNFLVKNTGQVTLTGVEVLDGTLDGPATCPSPATLNPDDTFICTGQYTVTALDVANRQVVNTASATGIPVRGLQPSASPSTAVVTSAFADVTVAKTTSTPVYTQAGDALSYSITLTNSGDDTLSITGVDDTVTRSGAGDLRITLGAPCNALPFALSPDDSVVCSASYTTIATDIASADDSVLNSVTVTGTSQTTGTVVTSTSSATSAFVSAGLTVTKSTDDTTYATTGDTLAYTIVITNTGDDTITGFSLDDTITRTGGSQVAGTLGTCSPIALGGTLSADDSTTCSATYLTTSDDTTTGDTVTNTATARGTGQLTGASVIADDSVVSRFLAASMTVVKTVDDTVYATADDTLTYAVVITNTGDDTLSIGAIDDTLTRSGAASLGISLGAPCNSLPFSLSPDDSVGCTGTYVTAPTDIAVTDDSVTNTVSVVGTAQSSGTGVSGTGSVTSTYVSAALTVAKTVDDTEYTIAGQTLTYTVVITNTGDDTLSIGSVDDTLTRSGAADLGISLGAPCNSLPFNLSTDDSVTCTGQYVTTSTDIASADDSVINTVNVSGTAQTTGTAVTTDDSVTSEYASTVNPDMTVTKSVTPTTYAQAGDSLAYSVTVTNTGDDTISAISVTDPLLTLTCAPAAPFTLNPGQSANCIGTYTTTAADVTAGSIINTATASGTPDSGGTLTRTGTVTATYSSPTPPPPPPPPPAGSIGVTKSASPTTFTKAGDRITYTVVATNTGQQALTNVSVADPKVTLTCTPTTPASLAIGASITCTGTYSIAQSDVDAGSVDNTATATGTSPGGTPVTGSGTARVTGNPPSALTVTKSASPGTFTKAGDRITYTVTATNSGDVTLTGVTVTDPKITLTCTPATPATLTPGARVTCTGTYTITQADVDAGSVSNTASATGKDPSGTDVTGSDTKRITTPSEGKLSVTKSASPTKFSKAGDRITYTVTATNSGDVTLTGVTVTDPKITLTCTPATPATLAPRGKVTCTGTYVVTQDDVDAGYVENSATASGTDPGGRPTTGTGSNTVPGVPSPGLDVTKSASPTTFTKVGDSLRFTVVATNTGTATLTGVTVTDPQAPLTCSPTTPARLAPGAKVTCTGTYAITQADVDNGSVSNTATASGKDPSGKDVTGRGSTTVPGPASVPSLHVAKSASPTAFGAVGEPIRFTVVATNNGNVTLTGVTVIDPLVSLRCAPSTPATMAPGARLTCTGTHAATQADFDRGAVTNTATATGTDPGGEPVIGTGSTQVAALAPRPKLAFTKSASVTTATAAGQLITYSFSLTNSGDVTVRALTVSDPLLTAPPSCKAAALTPGASTACTGTYVVTKSDLERGSITNVANASGTPARGTLAPITATVTIGAEDAWIKAREVTRQGRQGTIIAVERIRESPNLEPPRVKVACVPRGKAPRGDFSYCRWRVTPQGVIVQTVGRPVKVTVTIRAQLRNDPSTWVTKRYVVRTKR